MSMLFYNVYLSDQISELPSVVMEELSVLRVLVMPPSLGSHRQVSGVGRSLCAEGPGLRPLTAFSLLLFVALVALS